MGIGGADPSGAGDGGLSARARALLEATGEGIVAMDRRGICTYANTSAASMVGYEPGEMLGADVHALIHHTRPDGTPYPIEASPIHGVIRTGADVRVTEEVFWTREGRPLPVEYTSRPIVEGGRISGVAVAFSKRPEEQLPASDPRTENVLENITDAFYALDRDWCFTYVNSEAERFFGRSRDDLLGKNVWEEYPSAAGSEFYERFHWAVENQQTVEVEGYSSYVGVWFKARAYPSERGLSVYFLNVDERREADAVRELWQEDAERRAAELDAVIQSIPDAVYIGEEDGIKACNDAALGMLGFRDLAELNQNIGTLSDRLQNRLFRTGERIPPEEEPFARALGGETVVEEVISRHLQAGRDVVVRCAAAPIRYEGRIVGAVAVNTDITERKRAEEDLRDSEVFVRSTLNSLSAHIAILDETGLILATNQAWREFTGTNPPISTNAGTGTNYLEVCDRAAGEGHEDATAFARGIRDVVSGRRNSYELEYPCHSPEERRWFVGRVTRFPETDPPRAVVAHENVTERKLAMEEIELRARQQEAVADLGRRALTGPGLQVLMDEAVEVVARTLDVEYCKILELLPDGGELLLRAGVGWREGLVGTTTEEAGEGSQAGYTLLEDEPVIMEDLARETRFERPPLLHEHGVVSGATTVIRGQDEPFGVLGAHTAERRDFTENDVTFLRTVANVLGEAIEWRRAEGRMGEIRDAERRRMARDLHDGPLQDLTYALAAAQLVQSTSEDPKLNRWLEGTVEALKRTGRELRAAVHDLRLDEPGEGPFSKRVDSLVDLNRRMAPDRRVRLEVGDGFPDSPLGESDTELLRIIQEALTNTRRHSEAGNVAVILGSDEEEVWAEVEDDGRGFGVGTAAGVGLKSMRDRAHALGGALTVRSRPGRGTTVRFARSVGAGGAAEPEAETRVLLVEDHASFRDAAAAVLEGRGGFRVVGQAGTLAEARELVADESLAVDVAIVDLGLPDGYGGDLIRDLRETNPRAQALVLSATLDRTEAARAVESGAAGIVHKSAGMDEVLDAVRRLLAGDALMPLEEVVELLRLAASRRDEALDVRRAVARLTPRELEVLEALSEGLDGKEIARKLRISDKTERNHMASIMTKLGVHSRLQALVFALRHGVTNVR
jgi:PAS domain S-box-containing protein